MNGLTKYWLALAVIFLTGIAGAATAPLKPYQSGDWSRLIKTANGAPLAIHFWGVTCPACLKEMPQWGVFIKRHPNAKVIFIQVDDVSPEMMQKMLDKAGLDKANNYYIASTFDERLRYEIDPRWHRETPTTIFLDKNDKSTRTSGLLNFQELANKL